MSYIQMSFLFLLFLEASRITHYKDQILFYYTNCYEC